MILSSSSHDSLLSLNQWSGGRVLDPFAGSGTTLLAARNLGLGYVGIEARRSYYQIAKMRLMKGESKEELQILWNSVQADL
ncbi:DNA methyltransferase [Armatimonas sp.]|uniref:DNA methyltransferase n=1 Tax=Armatimonas sp. TaxID=1872638 RepID=UPI00374D24AB